jgi:cell division protein ZapA (FtsZ GTPase activity inhibitor)
MTNEDRTAVAEAAQDLRAKAAELGEESRVGQMFRNIAHELDSLKGRTEEAD